MRDDEQLPPVRSRLYRSYATTHAGNYTTHALPPIFASQIRPHLPPPGSSVLDLGCGQGALVRLLNDHGFVARGIDASSEQVALAQRIAPGAVEEADLFDFLTEDHPRFDAILAIDLLEHLTRSEVLRVLSWVGTALRTGGVFIARMPNAASPLGALYQFGDLTHETALSPRSFRQACAAAGLSDVACFPCKPGLHGLKSVSRMFVLRVGHGMLKLACAAETGTVRGHIVTANFVGVAKARVSPDVTPGIDA
jgi:2-polyprenyl-3-methyl-5-hydroxy-6-metoxy-1,4-benzoquinol methylase